MKKFLAVTAEKILAKHGNNLSNVLVLMPNQRSCTYFRNELKRQAKQAVFAPEISTLQNWMIAQSSLVVADNIELVTELHSCQKSIGGELSLDEFIGTANVMLSDFNELDLQLADAKSFFRNLELLQSMKTYEPGESPNEYKIKYRKFWEEFGLLYHHLRKRLKDKGKGYTGMILREVAESFSPPISNPVYLIGFSGLNKTDEVVIEHLVRQLKAQLLWDADDYYVKDEMNEAGTFFRKYQSKLRITKEVFHEELSTQPKNISVIGAAKNMGQVKVVADILQNKLKLTEKDLLDTVVVVPDEKLLSPLIASLPGNISSVNITMGLRIAGTNPATFLEILFHLQENAEKYQSKSRENRFYYKDVFELLQHNFFRLLFPGQKTEAFVQLMKEQNRILIRAEELSKAFNRKPDGLFFQGNGAKEFSAHLTEITSQLLDVLIKRAKAGNTAFASDAGITFRLLNILQNTQNVFTGENISIKTFIALLRENMHNERIPLEGDPVEGLQIMGLQETRSLDFKNVIVLSANEGILPSGKHTSTYIPYEVRREFLTTYKERNAVTTYLFYRLFHKAGNIFVLYNTEPDELGGGEKSRFILQLQHELNKANPKAIINDLIFAVDPPVPLGEQEIRIDKNEEVMKKLMDILTKSGLSPSALNSYINCTLQYYFRYIAGLREQDDMEESLEAVTIGDAVHYTLENIYKETKNKTISVGYIESLSTDKRRIETFVRERFSKRFDTESLSRGKNLLLLKVCVKLVEEFLKYEKQNLEYLEENDASLQIEMLEEKLQQPVEVNGKQLLIQGRVDRIENTDGIIQIVDFKTSTKSTIPILNEETWEELMSEPKFSKPVQLLIYAWLYSRSQGSKDISLRSGIYWLRAIEKKLDTLRVDKESDLITSHVIMQFEEKLKHLLAGLIDTSIPFTKTDDEERCKYCEFANICQRN